MLITKYIVISSFVQFEQKTSVTATNGFNTAIEALLHHKNCIENDNKESSYKSYSFYEICHFTCINSIHLYTKSEEEMKVLARIESANLLAPAEIPPVV
jgi:hypothetical protein